MSNLRKLTIEDAKEFFDCAWDENVHRYMPGYYCDTLERAQEVISNLLSDSDTKAYVIKSLTHSFIGVIVAVKKGKRDGRKEVEISYFINERFRHKGYATAAVEQILKKYKKYRVYFDIDSTNSKSLGLAKKFNVQKGEGSMYFFDNNI